MVKTMPAACHLLSKKLRMSVVLSTVAMLCAGTATASHAQTLTSVYSPCSQPNCAAQHKMLLPPVTARMNTRVATTRADSQSISGGKLVGIQGGINPVPFVALNPSTGTVATVASLPFGCAYFGDDYALDATAHRYFVFGSQLLSDGNCSSQLYVTAVDTTTGAVLSQPPLAGSIENMVFDANLSLTSVTSAPNPSTLGELVTITATVSPAGSPAPTGTVSFTSNGMGISGCASILLSSSLTAICMTSTLAVGTDAIVATYSGDENYDGSIGTLSQLVNPLPVALQITPPQLRVHRPTSSIRSRRAVWSTLATAIAGRCRQASSATTPSPDTAASPARPSPIPSTLRCYPRTASWII